MRIRKITLENHPILGNLHLDFTDENGESVDTIILAGENGTGKTSILDLLFEFSHFNIANNKRNEKRTFEIELTQNELAILYQNSNYTLYFGDGFFNGIFIIEFDFNIVHNWNHVNVYFKDAHSNDKKIRGDFAHHPEIKPILKCVYSDVEINYTPQTIKSVTAKDLDETNLNSYKSDGSIATNITQLLIDVEALDSQEFAQWGKQNIGKPVDETILNKRIKRFTSAFDSIFPSKKFLGVINNNNHKEVMFEEDGKEMSIDKLSSGEKQIVFRGGFLLKDKAVNTGSIVLIDEPEISLHPKWQIEILDFYKKIVNSDSEVISQIFISTHSPFIIHNPNRQNDKVIVLTKTEDKQITTLSHPEFYSWTNNKIVKEAFRIDYNLGSTKNKLFVEGETDEKYLNKALEIFNLKDTISFDIAWIGRINENGNTEFTGDTALNQAKSFFLANSDLLHSKIILCYDSDTNKPEETHGNLCVKKMPRNTNNEIFKIGIENLLELPPEFDRDTFYSQKTKVDDYGAESIIRTLDKTKLVNWICDDCNKEQQIKILENLKELLIKINEEVK